MSELALDVDTLRFQSFLDELQGRRVVNDYDDDYGYDDDDIINNSDGSATANGAVLGSITSNSNNNEGSTNTMIGSIQVLQNSALLMMQESFDGVVVSSVAMGGLAWEAGVRAGDVLTATSATMGNVSAVIVFFCVVIILILLVAVV